MSVLTGYTIPSQKFSEAMALCNRARDNFKPLAKKDKKHQLEKIIKGGKK